MPPDYSRGKLWFPLDGGRGGGGGGGGGRGGNPRTTTNDRGLSFETIHTGLATKLMTTHPNLIKKNNKDNNRWSIYYDRQSRDMESRTHSDLTVGIGDDIPYIIHDYAHVSPMKHANLFDIDELNKIAANKEKNQVVDDLADNLSERVGVDCLQQSNTPGYTPVVYSWGKLSRRGLRGDAVTSLQKGVLCLRRTR